jgi:hypothetical protein
LFKKGLWLAQVPENSPSFFAHILIAIPAKASPRSKNVIKNNSICMLICCKNSNLYWKNSARLNL